MPGGGIPIGAPRPGGIPIGGPMGGLMPGGGPIIPRHSPGGGAPRPIGGGAPRPGGYCVGAPAMLAPAAAAATVPRPWGVITLDTQNIRPAGAWGMGAPAGTPRPAARPTPGPPATPASGTLAMPVWNTRGQRFSPRSRTRPRTRFSSRSGCFEFLGSYLIFLNSSQSQRMRFMCLSKALKVPMKMRPSCRMHLILKSMCCSILLLFPTVYTHTHTHTHTHSDTFGQHWFT
uniref:Uncharacterized protein n=1 Tax=Gadus morhua TaxID=8049 RepID=A0A8C5B0W1_GADMO